MLITGQQFTDLLFIQGNRLYMTHVRRYQSLWIELDCTDAITTNLGQQIKGLLGGSLKTGLDPGPNGLIVGQQVIEKVVDYITLISYNFV